MLDLVYGVKIFFRGLGHVDFDGVYVVVCFDQNVAFLHVFVDVYFNFDSVAGYAADRMFLEFVFLEQNIDNFLVGAVVDGA